MRTFCDAIATAMTADYTDEEYLKLSKGVWHIIHDIMEQRICRSEQRQTLSLRAQQQLFPPPPLPPHPPAISHGQQPAPHPPGITPAQQPALPPSAPSTAEFQQQIATLQAQLQTWQEGHFYTNPQ